MQRPRSGKESNNYKNDRGGPTLIDQAANFVAACPRTRVTTIAIVITKGNTVSLFRWCLLHMAAVSNLHNNRACNNEHVECLNAIPHSPVGTLHAQINAEIQVSTYTQ